MQPGMPTRPHPWRIVAALTACVLALAGCSSAQSAPTPSPTRSASITRDLVFAQPDGTPLKLDACVPEGTSAPLPAVVIVHSGSWSEGTHSDLDWLCEQGAQHGFAAFTVDYRLLPAAHFPAQLDDVASAVDWISAAPQAKRFHVDPRRVTLLGTSAGAAIVAELLTGVPGSPVKPSRFVGGALLSAPVDLTVLVKDTSDPSALAAPLAYAGCSTVDCPALRSVSAALWVDATDPPMFLANSTDELVPLSQAEEMAAALKKAGVRHELRIAPGKDHAEFIAQNHPDIDAAMWAFLSSVAR